MQTTPIRINNLPIGIICNLQGTIEFVKLTPFSPVVEYMGDGVQICVSMEDVVIGTETYNYGEPIFYKQEPELLAWLTAQAMYFPNFI